METKPKRVEVGQRWKLDGLDTRPYAVEGVRDGVAYFEGGGCNPVGSMLTNAEWEFHGVAVGGPPSKKDMGIRPNGTPAACLRCGGQWDRENSDFVCRDCCEKTHTVGGTCSCGPLIRAWDTGARDFPRPPQAPVAGPTAKCSETFESLTCELQPGHVGD